MSFQTVFTKDALPPAGPYSQAIVTAPFVFVSGQIPATPAGEIIRGSITDQTEASIANIKAVLIAAGSSIEKVVKVNVFITDMTHFKEMNETYVKHFVGKPARSCVAVKELPLAVQVEIECTALL